MKTIIISICILVTIAGVQVLGAESTDWSRFYDSLMEQTSNVYGHDMRSVDNDKVKIILETWSALAITGKTNEQLRVETRRQVLALPTVYSLLDSSLSWSNFPVWAIHYKGKLIEALAMMSMDDFVQVTKQVIAQADDRCTAELAGDLLCSVSVRFRSEASGLTDEAKAHSDETLTAIMEQAAGSSVKRLRDSGLDYLLNDMSGFGLDIPAINKPAGIRALKKAIAKNSEKTFYMDTWFLYEKLMKNGDGTNEFKAALKSKMASENEDNNKKLQCAHALQSLGENMDNTIKDLQKKREDAEKRAKEPIVP